MLVRGKESARGRLSLDQFRKLVSQLRTVTHLPGVCAGILLFISSTSTMKIPSLSSMKRNGIPFLT